MAGDTENMAGASRYVALVDDDVGACVGLARLLRAVGMHVSTFSSAEGFLESGPPWPYDCLVLDVRLTGMSGLELLRRLDEWNVRLPVLMVSADDDPKTRDQARRLGALGFFYKTEPGDALIDAITGVSVATRTQRGATA